MTFIRSLIFDILYFGWTIFFSIFFLWAFFLPEKTFRKLMYNYYAFIHFLEKYILGLDYVVKGTENIPSEGAFIVASKHQSTYETFKFFLLFDDMVFLLKKELMQIPIWGWYPWKMGFVGVDRGKGRAGMKALKKAVNTVVEKERNLLIFPQGTRVPIGKDTNEYPYKSGINRIYEQSGLPIVPVAINAGYFWGKNKFLKKSGVVTFEILPVIESGLPAEEMAKRLETEIEAASARLLKEAQDKY